jgi:acetoin utilization deacetylase AcuC-like enzyme
MKVVYSSRYSIEIGRHVFPTVKYGRVFERVRERGWVTPADLVEPAAATWDELGLVHTAPYLAKTRSGGFSDTELAQLEIPWSPDIVDGFRLMTGGTITTARQALADAMAVHLGGGFHHAFADHGEGFCLYNDVAVAIRVLQREARIRRAAVIDLDVHHGNGTSALFAGDEDVFTLSIHQQHNYPGHKPAGSIDVGLEDGTTDEAYVAAVADVLPRVIAWRPDLAFYLAGADPYADDQLGGLALTQDGLRRRDERVIGELHRAGIAVAIVLAGGYARRLEDTVAIHASTVAVAREVASRR